MSDNAITVTNVSKDFRLPQEKAGSIKSLFTTMFTRRNRKIKTQHALKDVSFEVKKGEFFGIVGRNGSGKSTMLKMLAGIYQLTRGLVHVEGKLVPFIELGVGFNPELTGKQNVYLNGALLGFSEKEVSEQYDAIVSFAELEDFMDQKLKNYSSGMQVRLAFSMATRARAEVLLIDEVLAVGDADFQRKCFEYFKQLKKNNTTVIFVTHDMNAVREFCDRAVLIDAGRIAAEGKPQDVAREYALLFIHGQDANNEVSNVSGKSKKRWGNGNLKMSDIDIKVTDSEVCMSVKAIAKSDVEGVIYGLHILGQDGREITAMNNQMLLLPDIKKVPIGSEVSMEWKVQNIFNDGKYWITLTLIDEARNPLDWYIEAASFIVKRAQRSTTAVLPPVSVKTNIKKQESHGR